MDNYCLKNGIYVLCDDVFNAMGLQNLLQAVITFSMNERIFILECVNTHDIYISLFAIQL